MTPRIYLDHAATTPLHPEVADAMLPWLTVLGNPSSGHLHGRHVKEALDVSRERVSAQLGALFGEICFVGSGTEAANLAMLGLAMGGSPKRTRVLMSEAEHHCFLYAAPLLARMGITTELIRVDELARVDLDHLAELLADDVLAVVAMHANNEFGTFNDLAAISRLTKSVGAMLVVDAVQTAAHHDIQVSEIGADILTFASHKFSGPKGVGALWIASGTPIEAVVRGGGQERDMRAGTENVPGIVGFAEAWGLTASRRDKSEKAKRSAKLAFLSELGPLVKHTVPPDISTLSGHAHVRIPGVLATSLLIALDRRGVSASSGSACSSGSIEPSHVLLAAGYDPAEAEQGLRFTFGPEATIESAKLAAGIVREEASRILGRG